MDFRVHMQRGRGVAAGKGKIERRAVRQADCERRLLSFVCASQIDDVRVAAALEWERAQLAAAMVQPNAWEAPGQEEDGEE